MKPTAILFFNESDVVHENGAMRFKKRYGKFKRPHKLIELKTECDNRKTEGE